MSVGDGALAQRVGHRVVRQEEEVAVGGQGAHLDELQVELLDGPHLGTLAAAPDQDGRLANEAAAALPENEQL